MSAEDLFAIGAANDPALAELAFGTSEPLLQEFIDFVDAAELARGLWPHHVVTLLDQGHLLSQLRAAELDAPGQDARAVMAAAQGEPWGTKRNQFESAFLHGDDFLYAMLTVDRSAGPTWAWVTVILDPPPTAVCVPDNSLGPRYWDDLSWDYDKFIAEVGSWQSRAHVTLVRLGWRVPHRAAWPRAIRSETDGEQAEAFTEVIVTGQFGVDEFVRVTMTADRYLAIISSLNSLGTSTGGRGAAPTEHEIATYQRLTAALELRGRRIDAV